jgi:CDP-diacylglycerol--glycerol-3-phosphate 3-phosphatidyltransferase
MKRVHRAAERALLGTVRPVVDWMVERRVNPNVLTTCGFLVTVGAGLAFHAHRVRLAGALVLLGGLFDVFDGQVARRSGRATKFGSFYDSTLDRISEVAMYLGILSLYNDYRLELGDVGMIYAVMLAMAGSLLISYTRARAEGLGIDCKVGLMQRPERILLIGLASLLFGESARGLALKVVIVVLAVLTNLTAIHRMVWVWLNVREPAPLPPEPGPRRRVRQAAERWLASIKDDAT